MPSKPKTVRPGPPKLPQDLFRAAVEQADIAISITDPRAHIEYLNPAFTQTTGFEVEEALGQRHSLLASRTTPAEVYEAMWKAISNKSTWQGRLVNRRKDGSQYLAEVTITPVLDEAGNISHYLGMHRDISPLHRLECAVHNQKALIESVVDSAPTVLALLNMQDRVMHDNHAYKALTADLGMQEAAGILLSSVRNSLSRGFGPPRPGAHAFLDEKIRLDRPHWPRPRWYACSGVWVSNRHDDSDAFFENSAETYLLLVANDITRQIVEQEKARVAALQASLAEATRRQSLRESMQAAVFQMEGPLNVLESVLNIMGRRGCDPAQDALAEALKAGQAGLTALRSAIPPTAQEACSNVYLNEAVRDVLDLQAETLLSKGVELDWAPQPVLPSLWGQGMRLRVMLKALIDNAVDAVSEKGWKAREVAIRTSSSEETLCVEIADRGPGIPAENRLQAFEPFWTTRKGSGLHLGTGLSSALQIAVDHGGSIELEESPGGGCLARVLLPIRSSESGY